MRHDERTLRSRLTCWMLLAAIAVLALCAAAWLPARRAQFRRAADDELLRAAEVAVARVRAQPAPSPAPCIGDEDLRRLLGTADLPAPVVAGALQDREGRVSARWNVAQVPPTDRGVSAGALVPRFASTSGAPSKGETSELRWVTLPFEDGERLGFLSLAAPERAWTPSAGQIALLAAVGVLVLGLAAPLGARALARRLLTPVYNLAESARAVSPRNPGGRFHARARDSELRRLEEELNAALRRMEDAMRTQAQFAGNVAHELKTPIAVLVADAQVVRRGTPSLKESHAFLARAEEELLHLGNLVESFLVLARIETQAHRADLIYADDVVRRAEKRCRRTAERAGVRLVLELATARERCDPFVRGDLELLQAMVENLVRNAVTHSPRGGSVVVRTQCSREAVRIEVRDEGQGIPAEYRERVFERGVRVPDEDSDPGGLGLGLSIVHNVAQLHGGHVSIETSQGGGTAFLVEIPAVDEHAQDAGLARVTDS